MAQSYKVEKVNALKEELKEYTNFIFTDYRGMNVRQMSGLRNTLREKGVSFHVIKNRSIKRAFNELGLHGLDGFLINPTALACFNIDIPEIAKIFTETVKDTTLQLKGGYAGGRLLSPEDIALISKLPSREALIAQTIGLFNAPIAGFIMVLGGVLTKFVRMLKAIEEKKAN